LVILGLSRIHSTLKSQKDKSRGKCRFGARGFGARLQKKSKLAIIVNSIYFNVLSTFYPYFSTLFPPRKSLAVLVFCFIKYALWALTKSFAPEKIFSGGEKVGKNPAGANFRQNLAKLIFGL